MIGFYLKQLELFYEAISSKRPQSRKIRKSYKYGDISAIFNANYYLWSYLLASEFVEDRIWPLFLNKLKLELPHDSVIPLLGISWRKS